MSHTMIETGFICDDCKKPIFRKEADCTTGYGIIKEDGMKKKVCFACCGIRDSEIMKTENRTTLYLSVKDGKRTISNWPGSLVFHPYWYSEGRHNIAGKQYHVNFKDTHGNRWHGVQYGDNTQILHCKKIKG